MYAIRDFVFGGRPRADALRKWERWKKGSVPWCAMMQCRPPLVCGDPVMLGCRTMSHPDGRVHRAFS